MGSVITRSTTSIDLFLHWAPKPSGRAMFSGPYEKIGQLGPILHQGARRSKGEEQQICPLFFAFLYVLYMYSAYIIFIHTFKILNKIFKIILYSRKIKKYMHSICKPHSYLNIFSTLYFSVLTTLPCLSFPHFFIDNNIYNIHFSSIVWYITIIFVVQILAVFFRNFFFSS